MGSLPDVVPSMRLSPQPPQLQDEKLKKVNVFTAARAGSIRGNAPSTQKTLIRFLWQPLTLVFMSRSLKARSLFTVSLRQFALYALPSAAA